MFVTPSNARSLLYPARILPQAYSFRTTIGRGAYILVMNIHFVGINGVSMRALADLAASRGHNVTGSDRSNGDHDAKNVVGCDLVVYTNAVPPDNCELVAARRLGIPTVERATYLGELSRSFKKTIAVAGCHGKSTATAMLGKAFAAEKPTVHVGVAGGSTLGGRSLFITEACEYNKSFLHLRPDLGIVLNLGYDHPDCYTDGAAVERAFSEFCAASRRALVNGDDARCRSLCENPITFGLDKRNDYRAEDIKSENGCRSFSFVTPKRRAAINLSVAGGHNVYNALAALAAADVMGASASAAIKGVNGFDGIPRRFERKCIAYGKTVLTDYAHHPDEITATINVAREIFPSVAVVFQPHTYSRTRALLNEFADALENADTVLLAPIFPARETADLGVSSGDIAKLLREKGKRAYCFDTMPEIVLACKTLKEKAVIFMGAGDIDKAADRLAERAKADGEWL